MNENKTNINWYPGHMAKTKRLINESKDLIDIVYELIDARIPKSSKMEDKDNLLLNKPHILIMTKYDLCDKVETDKWIEYYKNNGYKVIKLNLNDSNVNFKELIDVTNELMNDVQQKRLNKGLKEKEIRALVLGIPNVGKSTFINRFIGKNVANTGNKPGVTTNLVWLKSKSNILLLDTPGILWPKIEDEEVALNLASMSAIREEVLPIGKVACHILEKLNIYYNDKLQNRYGINNIDDIIETYDIIGKKIGAYKNGEADYNRVSEAIINDVKSERVKDITFDRK